MNELGSTTFGYVIAYLLPGLVGSVGAALLSEHLGRLMSSVIQQQNLPLAVMGTLAAIAAGIFTSLFRALIFEEWLWRSERLTADDYSTLAEDEQTFRAYDRVVDDAYRFHQFWGGMALALPVLLAGIVSRGLNQLTTIEAIGTFGGFVALEAGAIWGARTTYKRYLIRVKQLLRG